MSLSRPDGNPAWLTVFGATGFQGLSGLRRNQWLQSCDQVRQVVANRVPDERKVDVEVDMHTPVAHPDDLPPGMSGFARLTSSPT